MRCKCTCSISARSTIWCDHAPSLVERLPVAAIASQGSFRHALGFMMNSFKKGLSSAVQVCERDRAKVATAWHFQRPGHPIPAPPGKSQGTSFQSVLTPAQCCQMHGHQPPWPSATNFIASQHISDNIGQMVYIQSSWRRSRFCVVLLC